MASVSEVTKQLRIKLNQLEVQAAEIKLARLNVAQKDTEDVDGKTNNIPEIKVESDDHAVPPIFIIEPATPNPDPEEAAEMPKVLGEPPPPRYTRNGLTLDLQCPAIPEVTVDSVHQDTTKNTQEENAIVIRENDTNGDSKSPEITACDIPISNGKFSKPRADTNHVINVPSPERANAEGPYAPNCTQLLQNPQNLLLANNS